jgi:DNA helicase-2/ATP-dependent DNA helicase PcrA
MQSAIFAAVEDPEGGNLVVEALAGTGKSTTIEECVTRTDADSSVLVCAFNAAIAASLKPRMPEGVEVSTIHSFGLKALRNAFGSLEVDKFKVSELCKEIVAPDWGAREARTTVTKLVSIAKGQAFEAVGGGRAKLDVLDEWADDYGVDFPKGWERGKLVSAALQILRAQQREPRGSIDFDDMIWLPVVLGIEVPSFNYVFVDETQDLNPAQLELVKRAGEGGRVIAVGDRRQAIYGFRGADSQAIPRMVEELGARVLPLSITYRCPRGVVRCANQYVPALEAAPGAPEGEVRAATMAELEDEAQAGDFVLSRTNAPLVSLAFRWIAAGVPARIQGRDIGTGLATWVKAQNVAAGEIGMRALRAKIEAWRDAEVTRLIEKDRDTQAVVDKAACLTAIAMQCKDVGDMLKRIEALFSDSGPRSAITLSSTHRAKGLEADRVWLLRDTYLKWKGAEEENLLYVAITRSKRELIFVSEK